MSFVDLLANFKKVQTDITGGQYAQALKDCAPILDGTADLLLAVGFKSAPGDATCKADCVKCIEDCIAECDKCHPKCVGVAAGPVDSSKLVELLKTLLLTILPLFL